jgi:CHAT domain-containing protein
MCFELGKVLMARDGNRTADAGVRAVIGALWPVFDDAAMLICDRFYYYYLDDQGREMMPPAQALLLAQAWLRKISVS